MGKKPDVKVKEYASRHAMQKDVQKMYADGYTIRNQSGEMEHNLMKRHLFGIGDPKVIVVWEKY